MITKLENGKYYLLRWSDTRSPGHDFLYFVEEDHLVVLASTISVLPWVPINTLLKDTLKHIIMIDRKDLPLYIGWKFIHPSFIEHIERTGW
jgi:hypothetical protein